MSGYRAPGPTGLGGTSRMPIDRGTLARTAASLPGSFRGVPPFADRAPRGPVSARDCSQQADASVMNIDAAVTRITAIALATYSGKCATHVRKALQAGGLDTTGNPLHAKDYGPFLLGLGFTAVSTGGYSPRKGDIVVFQDYPTQSSPSGHIQMYSGSEWISDTRQPRFLAHQEHYRNIPYAIYRP